MPFLGGGTRFENLEHVLIYILVRIQLAEDYTIVNNNPNNPPVILYWWSSGRKLKPPFYSAQRQQAPFYGNHTAHSQNVQNKSLYAN